MNNKVEYGIYKHFRGKLYQVFGTAIHSETGEKLVVYEPIGGGRGLWARPIKLFLDDVETDNGSIVRRFVKKQMRSSDIIWPNDNLDKFTSTEFNEDDFDF